MKLERSSGILLHPSSLPGSYGIGDIGPQAFRWVDFLAESGCSLWQILPLGPTGYGDSPYQSFSAFAGNPYLISPEILLSDNLLSSDDLVEEPQFPSDRVEFGKMIWWKLGALDRAYIHFEHSASEELCTALTKFCDEQASWLDDFGLFMAIKEAHGGKPWVNWEPELRDRNEEALAVAREKYQAAIQRQIFRQFIFNRQWKSLYAYAKEKGIKLIGDIPIFIAHDSADVWAHPELFFLDEKGKPLVVAGVPPDYFSTTGQLWGNPLYRWNELRVTGYRWWIDRIRTVLNQVDYIRLDHFRGFAGYWEVPGSAKTAETGRWVPGPGKHFFQELRTELGELPFIAEDLGVITEDVVELRDHFGFPGMKILQFAFEGGPKDPFLPHQFPNNCVVYTGTHDNDTARGWYDRVSSKEHDFYQRYINSDGSEVAWDFIRACWSSVAVFAIAPMQDFLDLDNRARMNYPGNPSGNWTWRMSMEDLNHELLERIFEINYLYDRLNRFIE